MILLKKLLSGLFSKLFSLVEGVVSWCVGLGITGCVFALLVLYVIPFAAHIPLDANKYIARATSHIAAIPPRAQAPEPSPMVIEEGPPLTENIFRAVDNAADNLIKWINRKPDDGRVPQKT